MHVTIRADGGAEIGYGHLFRTNAVTEELLDRGHQVSYITSTPDAVESICHESVGIFETEFDFETERLSHQIPVDVDVVLIDWYHANEHYQRSLRKQFPVAVISDDTRHTICSDLLINGNLYAPKLEYKTSGDDPIMCLGPKYLSFRQSIRSQAIYEPPWRERPKRALVTLGGSDPTNQTPDVVKAFDGTDLHVDIIIGPGFSEEQESEVRRIATKISAETFPLRDPDNLAQLMLEADFAVSTASTTTYELLLLGTPIISFPVVDNQTLIAEELSNRNAATVLPFNPTETQIRTAIDQYMDSPTLRRNRKQTGRFIVDRKGTQRITEQLLEQGAQ